MGCKDNGGLEEEEEDKEYRKECRLVGLIHTHKRGSFGFEEVAVR